MLLKPGPGKIYNCIQEVQKDWNEYVDFYIHGKGYFNKSDAETMKISNHHLKGVEIRVKYRKGESCVVDIL